MDQWRGDWIVVQGYHVDLIFRDINSVSEVMDDCLEGRVSTHYHTGHPHAYLNVMYMGEISICNILYERAKQISDLKAKTRPFPKALRDAIVGYFVFEANFSLMFAKDNVDKDDAVYVMGHCFRSVACLNQVLFALNEEYCINEKNAVRMIEGFNYKPKEYKLRIDQMITLISSVPDNTMKGVKIFSELISETEMLLKNTG